MTVVVYGGLFLFLRFGRWGVRMLWTYGSGFPFTPAFRNDRRPDPALTNSRRQPSQARLTLDGQDCGRGRGTCGELTNPLPLGQTHDLAGHGGDGVVVAEHRAFDLPRLRHRLFDDDLGVKRKRKGDGIAELADMMRL